MRRYLPLALACMLAVVPFGALALGLGEIRLNSYLNQPLDAEIELVSAAADELESLTISLADSGAFERSGLERIALLNTLQFNVVQRPNGTAYVKITSREAIKEPFLTFLVEADWSRGRLMREYTLLLDPPTFADAAAPAETQAPAVVPEFPAATLPEERAPVAEPAETPSFKEERPVMEELPAMEAPAEEQAGDVIRIPPLEAETEQPAPARAQTVFPEPEMGGSYGPIQRNETLWGIATRLRPDESITINQMMLALYRANPEAFHGNINRLKAGYILRIPEYAEITSLSRGEAFQEAKRQNEEWQAERTGAPLPTPVDEIAPEPVIEEPELSLVAPEEEFAPELGTGVGAGGEADDIGMADEAPAELTADDIDEDALDLGVETETPERLLDIEDESLEALQAQEDLLESGEAVETLPEETITGEMAPEEMAPPPLPGEQAAEPVTEDATLPVDEAPAPADTGVAEQPAETPAAVTAPSRRQPEPDLVERILEMLLSPLGLGVAAAVLVLLLAGFLVIRKRREASHAQAAAAMAGWGDAESEDVTAMTGDDETIFADHKPEPGISAVFAHDLGQEDTGTTKLDEDDAATQMLDGEKTQFAPPPPPQAKVPDFTDTLAGGQAMTLDDNDPLSEADFHMAYGLYDQAAEVVQKAANREPERKELHAKLAEIHFASNNTDGFLEAADRLKELVGPGDSDWDNVAIMGRQIAPDNPLFAASGGSTGAVDLDFGAAAEEFGGSATPPSAKPAPADDSLDFDLDIGGSEAPTEMPAAAATSASDGLDFDLDSEDGTPAETVAAEPGDFDLGDLDSNAAAEPAAEESASGYRDEDTQSEFDKALDELSAYVDTNLPEQDAGDATTDETAGGDLSLDDYSFDEQAPEGLGGDDAGIDAEEEDDIGEIGTKLDLARAYIDMGDPDGARGILEEVMADGDAEQQQEAQQLLDQIA